MSVEVLDQITAGTLPPSFAFLKFMTPEQKAAVEGYDARRLQSRREKTAQRREEREARAHDNADDAVTAPAPSQNA